MLKLMIRAQLAVRDALDTVEEPRDFGGAVEETGLRVVIVTAALAAAVTIGTVIAKNASAIPSP